MKVHFIIEIIFAFVALLLINIYYVELSILKATIVSGITTIILGFTVYFLFIKNKLNAT
jgi:hypothetical protein